MAHLKLYNWYGDSFDSKKENTSDSIRLFKRQMKNTFDRKKRDIAIYKKMNKNLFVKAKSKLNDESKRILKSVKVEYKNKQKVQKDLIKELKIADSIESLIKFELKKIALDKKEIKKYTLNYLDFTKNSGDDTDVKLKNIENILKESQHQENQKIVNEIYLNLILKLSKNNLTISHENIKSLQLDQIEKKFIESHKFNSQKISMLYEKLLKVQKELLLTKDKSINKYKNEFINHKKQYLLNIKEIKKKYKDRIILAEKNYATAVYQMQKENSKELKEAKIKLNTKIKSSQISKNKKQHILTETEKYQEEIEKIKYKNTLKYLKKSFKLDNFINKLEILKNAKLNYEYTLLISKIKIAKNDLENFYLIKSKKEIEKLTNEKFIYNKIDFKKSLKEAFDEMKNFDNFLAKQNQFLAFKKYFSKEKLSFFNWDKYDIQKNKAKISYYQNLGMLQKKYTYESELNEKKSVAIREYNNDLKTQIKIFENEKLESYQFLCADKNNYKDKQKQEFYRLKALLMEEKQKNIGEAKQGLSNKTFSKQAYKNVIKKIKMNFKEKINDLKFQNDELKHKNVIKTLRSRYWSKKKMIKKIYEGKVLEANKQTPVEVKKQITWVAALMNLILPGLSELFFFNQKKKGILLILVQLFMYTVFLPFSLGITYSKIGGVLGLVDLGSNIHDFNKGIVPDARYWLFGGVASVFLLVFMLAFQISSSVSAYRVAKLMKEGTRPSNWTHTKRWLNTSGFPWLISLPGWFLIIFIVITPIVASVLISFTNMGFNHEPPGKTVDWIGLDQYGKWWTFRNVGMMKSLFRVLSWTVIWTLATATLVIAVGTLFAVALNNPRIKFKKIFRLIYIIPWAIPAFITIIFLKSAFQPDSQSLINFILIKVGIINEPINWWSSVWTIRTLLIIIQVWLGHSYIFLLVTGHIQSIPKDIYEAGSIDGANKKQLFRYLTIPSLLAAIAPLLITQFTFAFNNFTIIALFSGGGPRYIDSTPFLEGGTDILISWIYKLTTSIAQIDGNTGFAAAMTTLAALISISVASYGFAKSISKGSR